MDVVTESLSACFTRTQELCAESGYSVSEIPSNQNNALALEVLAHGRQWQLSVDCDWPTEGTLPSVHLLANEELLAHVSCTGWVCVNDSESLSIDLSRHADTVAQTVIATIKLLEKSADDAEADHTEFLNELEGYWSNLPSTLVGKTTVEVDEHSRPARMYIKGADNTFQAYFLEESATPPTEFPKFEGRYNRAVYLPLERAILPPPRGERLMVDYLDKLKDEFSQEQLPLWKALLGNGADDEFVALLVSMPRAAGGRSLLGFLFRVKEGAPVVGAQMSNLLMLRHTVSHMRERGGADLKMGQKHVVVFGCGSVGSEVADALASSGVGKLTLVDPQALSSDNVFRHALGRTWIGTSKARALHAVLVTQYPGLTAEAAEEGAYRWLLSNADAEVDGYVIAVGMPTLERQLARTLRQSQRDVPIVHTWLEPLDLGGHAVLVNSARKGCLDCLYRDDEGVDSLSSRTAYLAPGQTLTRNLTGCASTFTPYGAIQSRRTALMASELMLKALSGTLAPKYVYWTGDGTTAEEHALAVTEWWRKARANSSLDMTEAMFGTPCKNCRGKK